MSVLQSFVVLSWMCFFLLLFFPPIFPPFSLPFMLSVSLSSVNRFYKTNIMLSNTNTTVKFFCFSWTNHLRIMCLILYVLAFWTFHGNKKSLIFFNFIKTFFQTQKDVNWTHTVSRKWRTKIAGHVTHVLTGILVSDWPERQRSKCSVSTNDHTWWHCTRPPLSAPGQWQAWAGGGEGGLSMAGHGYKWPTSGTHSQALGMVQS